MARKRERKEKDIISQMLDTIDFRRLNQDEVVWQGGREELPKKRLHGLRGQF